ncbi:beta strand repeat-containing protein, partial [Singulisphaera rosea]
MRPIDWIKGLRSASTDRRPSARIRAKRRSRAIAKSWNGLSNWEALERRLVLSASPGDNHFFGAIAVPGQVDTFQLNLATSTNLWFDDVGSSPDLRWTLSGPQGDIDSEFFYQADDALGRFAAGTYTITVAGQGSDTGSFDFRIMDTAAASTPITPGTTVGGSLTPAVSSNLYQFSGTAGSSVFLDATWSSNTTPNTFYGVTTLIGPDGTTVWSQSIQAPANRVTLPTNGTYTIAIGGLENSVGTATYQLRVLPITDGNAALSLNTPVTSSITSPGQQNNYTFTLNSPTRLLLDVRARSGDLIWNLQGPPGAVTNVSLNNTQDRLLGLLPAATYTLTVSGSEGALGSLEFNLRDLATATPITVGSSATPTGQLVSGNLNPIGSTNLYKINGNAGDSLFFDNLSLTGYPRWELIDPYGNVLFNTDAGSDVPHVTLPVDGAYTLVISGSLQSNVAPSYSFRVNFESHTIPPAIVGTAIVPGTPVTGSLAANSQANYRFTLSTPTRLWLDILSQTSDAASTTWSLSGPEGVISDFRSFSQGDQNLGLLPVGTYSLQIKSTQAASYAFTLHDFAAATSIAAGQNITSSLNPANSTDLFRISGNAGDVIFLDNTAFTTTDPGGRSGTWTLIGPYGTQVFSGALATDSGRITLPTTGVYTLVLQGDLNATGTSSDSFTVRSVADTTTALTLGTPVSDSIATPGQKKSYTFTLSTSTTLWFDSRTNNSQLYWTVSGPQNPLRYGSSEFVSSDLDLGSLPSGTYTLTVSASGDALGAFSFNLQNAAAATPITLGTNVSGSLNPASSSNLYRFNGVAGSSVYFDTLAFSNTDSSTGTVSPTLLRPDGSAVTSGFQTTVSGRVTFDETGIYTLIVQGANTATGTSSYTINVRPITDTTTPLTLGSPVSGTISSPGQQKNYTFTLNSPARLWLDGRSSATLLYWAINGPQGTIYYNMPFNSNDEGVGLLPAGAYTITVIGYENAQGDFSFNLQNFAAATPILPGSTVSGSLNPASSSNLYQFNGNAGDVIYLDSLSTSTTDPHGAIGTLLLLDPLGIQVTTNYLSVDGGRVTLPLTGTYTLIAGGYYYSTGTSSYSFNVRPVTDTNAVLTIGTPVSGAISSPGQQANYTFTLNAPTKLFFDGLTTAFGLSWSLAGPQGVVSLPNNLNSADKSIGLLPAATYTLTASDSDDTIGSFGFNLLDLASATPITAGNSSTPIGQVVSDTLNSINSARLYKFDAPAGETLQFHTIKGTNLAASWQLIDPLNNVISTGYVQGDYNNVTTPTSGTYTLAIYASNASTPPNFQFQINFGSYTQPPAPDGTPITLGTPVSSTLPATGSSTFLFTLASPTQIWFDTQTDASSLSWLLSGAQGMVKSGAFLSGDANFGLLPAGNYSLRVNGNNGDNVAFNLLDLATATQVSIGTLVDSHLTPADSTNLYQFSASAGTTIYLNNAFFTVDSQGHAATWTLIDPLGNARNTGSMTNSSGRLTLTISGTYTLVVAGDAGSTGSTSATFVVTPITDVASTLTLGTPVSDSISSPYQQRTYTFTLSAPTQVWFDSQASNSGMTWKLTAPQWTIHSNGSFSYGDRDLGLLPVGTYTLTVLGSGNTTGSFQFNLVDLDATATPITLGSTVTGTLTTASPSGYYRFSAAAGSVVYIDSVSLSTTDPSLYSPTWQLLDPYGKTIATGLLDNDLGRVTLPATGNYTLVLGDPSSPQGTTNFSFNVWPVVDNAVQAWGTSGNDDFSVRFLDANTRDVYLNGYLLGTVTGTTPLTINGQGGTDTLVVIGTAGADTFSITSSQISLGNVTTSLVGIGYRTVDGGAGNDVFNYSGANPQL